MSILEEDLEALETGAAGDPGGTSGRSRLAVKRHHHVVPDSGPHLGKGFRTAPFASSRREMCNDSEPAVMLFQHFQSRVGRERALIRYFVFPLRYVTDSIFLCCFCLAKVFIFLGMTERAWRGSYCKQCGRPL